MSSILTLFRSGQAKRIGISNIGPVHLQELVQMAEVQPAFVQNRCFANRGWDKEVRDLCWEYGIIYQGFSLLTANPQIVAHSEVHHIAERLEVTPQQVIFRFAKQIGILPLTGTSNEQHMKEDLAVQNFKLSEEDLQLIDSLG